MEWDCSQLVYSQVLAAPRDTCAASCEEMADIIGLRLVPKLQRSEVQGCQESVVGATNTCKCACTLPECVFSLEQRFSSTTAAEHKPANSWHSAELSRKPILNIKGLLPACPGAALNSHRVPSLVNIGKR